MKPISSSRSNIGPIPYPPPNSDRDRDRDSALPSPSDLNHHNGPLGSGPNSASASNLQSLNHPNASTSPTALRPGNLTTIGLSGPASAGGGGGPVGGGAIMGGGGGGPGATTTLENPLADLEPDQVPPEFKKEGSDWWAIYNQNVHKVLDVNLMMTMTHER